MSSIIQYVSQQPGFYTRSIELITEYSSTHAIFKIPLYTLLKLPICNWKYNRPPDMSRCVEIANYYRSIAPATQLDCILHLHLNTATGQFEVIDGIHRITALLELHRQFEMDSDQQHKYYWFYNTVVLVSIRKDKSDIVLAEHFHSINKSVSVPALYIADDSDTIRMLAQIENRRSINDAEVDDHDDTCVNSIQVVFDRNSMRRIVIENITKEWQIKYKPHFSPNDKCRSPNINRDRFIDILSEIWKVLESYYEPEDMEKEMNRILEEVNEYAKSLCHENSVAPTKVKKTGRYIFVWNKERIVHWAKMLSDKYTV